VALPRYRVTDAKGAYMPRSEEVELLQLGADHNAAKVYGIRSKVYELLKQGDELEFSGTPGPHLEPLNDEAREAMRAYWAANPGATLDPTRTLGLTGGSSIDLSGTLMIQLDRMLRDASDARPVPALRDDTELTALRAQVAELSAQVAALVKANSVPARRHTT
jgi:hypothetical protein